MRLVRSIRISRVTPACSILGSTTAGRRSTAPISVAGRQDLTLIKAILTLFAVAHTEGNRDARYRFGFLPSFSSFDSLSVLVGKLELFCIVWVFPQEAHVHSCNKIVLPSSCRTWYASKWKPVALTGDNVHQTRTTPVLHAMRRRTLHLSETCFWSCE